MLHRLRKLAAPPVFDSEEDTRAARILHPLVLTLIGGTGLVAILSLFTPSADPTRPINAASLLTHLTAFYLLRHGRVRATVWIVTIHLWLSLTLSNFLFGGIHSATFSAYVIVIVLVAILLSERIAAGLTFLSIFAGILMVYAQRHDLLPATGDPRRVPEFVLSIQVAILLVVGTLIYGTARYVRAAFERTRASEQQLIERNRQLEQQIDERQRIESERDRIFAMSLDIIVVSGMDGYIKRVNPAMARITGYSVEELLTMRFTAFTEPVDLEKATQEMGKLAQGIPVTNVEMRTLCKDGQIKWLSWNAVPVGDLIFSVGRDITEKKQQEQQQLELTLAREKTAFLSEFLGTISHDLKTPLSVINTYLYMLERNTDPSKQKHSIQRLYEQTQVLERFIQDILMVSRLEYVPEFEHMALNINTILSDVTQQLSPKAEQKHIQTHLELADNIPLIAADAQALQRAFTNIIENAVNYTPDTGTIDVRTHAAPDNVVVEIADTGIGIRDEDLPHIFDRFYRSAQARSLERGGTGLGLAIARKIIDMHRGQITVSSVHGQGTTFRVQIPVTLGDTPSG